MDIYPKFIIFDNDIVMSKVTFHKEIVPENKRHLIAGGGWFSIKGKELYLGGESHDYGKPSVEEMVEALKDKSIYTNHLKNNNIYDRFEFIYWDDIHGIRHQLK